MKRRKYKTSRIRKHLSYSVPEICEDLGVHRNTVREWIRQGLPKLDTSRPLLIYGSNLKIFLEARQKSRKKKCAFNELYCFRCRSPRQLMGNLADVHKHTEKTVMLSGLCEACHNSLNKVQSRKILSKLSETFDIPKQQLERLGESSLPSLDCTFNKERKNA